MTSCLYHACGVAPTLYPTITYFGLLCFDEKVVCEIPQMLPFKGEWGKISATHILLDDNHLLPNRLNVLWLSIVEKKFYHVECNMDLSLLENLWNGEDENGGKIEFTHIVVGMAPYGKTAVWISGFQKSALITWSSGIEVCVSMNDFVPTLPDITLTTFCEYYMTNNPAAKDNLLMKGLPSHNLFDKYMQQFTYRYLMIFEHWDEDKDEWKKYEEEEIMPELDFIEEALFDGTHDKLHDGGLMQYHQAGKPKKLAVQWHIKKSDYSAYFWLEDEEIRAIFDRFYGAHPDTKTDFMIRIDSDNEKFELALYRYGLKEPQVITESAYQLIVFKNKFEHFRSENYDQPRGAWIW